MPTLKISPKSPLHESLLRRIRSRTKIARAEQGKQWKRWMDAENKMVAYVPESDTDARRRLRREQNGEPQYTTIQLPYSYALVMTAHTYWTSVFFGRDPIHQFAGVNGTGEMQVQAMEALIAYQVSAGRMMAPYYIWMYDAAKYGHGVLGLWWDNKVIQYGSLESDPATGAQVQVSRSVMGYQGNCVFNVSPYDFFHDPRVGVKDFQRGEFCFVEVPLAWHEVQRAAARGDYMNTEVIDDWTFNVGHGDRENASSQVIRPMDNWSLDNGTNKKDHPARVRILEFHCEISPQEWGVGNAKSTEKWVFTVTADEKLIIGAQPLGAIHGEFPFDVLPCELENYGSFVRGYPEMSDGIQRTMDWLINTHFYNIRAALNNQFLFDPSKVRVKDFEKGGPGFALRLRPEAYGTDVRTAMQQFQVNDVTQTHMHDLDAMLAVGERTFGINDQMFGMMGQNGGRRTATEVRSSTGFGVNRQKTQTEWISAQAFFPHQQKLVSNTLQYYNAQKKIRIVGDAAQAAGQQFLLVTPETIAGEYDIVPVNGTLPIDRFAQVSMWKDLLSTLTGSPIGMQLLQQWDLGKLVGWIFSLGGLKNANQFKTQILPPGAGPSPGMVPMPLGAGGLSGSAPTAALMPRGGDALPAPTTTPAAGFDLTGGQDAIAAQ